MDSNRTNQPPFFIISAPRSGSTLLRLLLTAHPELCVPPESKFLVRLRDTFGAVDSWDENTIDSFLQRLYQDKKFPEWGIAEELLRRKLINAKPRSYHDAVDAVYRAYMAQTWPEATIWGDKNPGYRTAIPAILSVFRDARIVHLVRDVRAVYLSMKNISLKNKKRPMGKIAKATERWQCAIREVRKHARPGQFLMVRYEDLVAEPQPTLTKICKFLGVSFDPRMLAFYEENAKRGLVPPARLAKHTNTLKPISSQRANAWQSHLSLPEIEALEFRNRTLLGELGYPTTTNGLSWKGRARLVMDALELFVSPLWAMFRGKDPEEEDGERGSVGA